MKFRVQTKHKNTQDSIKPVLDVAGEISLALVKIQDALKALKPPCLDPFRNIFVIIQTNMATSASAPAPVLTRVEMVNKTQLQWLLTQVNNYVDDTRRPQVVGALIRRIGAYDDDMSVYTVEYRQKVYGGKAPGRLWASSGMHSFYKPLRWSAQTLWEL
jgi:hypothetical protein